MVLDRHARPAPAAQTHHRAHGRGVADDAGALPTTSSSRASTTCRARSAERSSITSTITTSGFFTVPPFLAALLTFGADRILFSVDYPFAPNAQWSRLPGPGLAWPGRSGQADPQERGFVTEAESRREGLKGRRRRASDTSKPGKQPAPHGRGPFVFCWLRWKVTCVCWPGLKNSLKLDHGIYRSGAAHEAADSHTRSAVGFA